MTKYTPEWREGCSLHYHDTPAAYHEGCRCRVALNKRRTREKLAASGLLPPGWVDGRSTRRRIQALWAIGWTAELIGKHAGLSADSVLALARHHGAGRVLADNAKRIAKVYEELQGTAGPSVKAEIRARSLGYAPPLAWLDIDRDERATAVRRHGVAS